MSPEETIARTRRWLERAVIGLNLCPFAKAVYAKQQVRFVVTDAAGSEALLEALQAELVFLRDAEPEGIDTTLLIHPHALTDFIEYNDFLDEADAAVRALQLEGTIQIASFHPEYRFAGTLHDDMGNFTNRAPFPMLHLLREASVERAVDAFPDPEAITDRNISTLERLGPEGWRSLLDDY